MGLDTVEIVMAVEEHFDISISAEVAERCVTVGDTQREVAQLLAIKRSRTAESLLQEAWEGIVLVTTYQMNMPASKIKPTSRWVGDITKHG